MHHSNAARSVVGHVARNGLTFLRPQRTHPCRLTLEISFEDAEIRRLARIQGLHVERTASCLDARNLARKRQVRFDVVLPEMCGVLRLIEGLTACALNSSRFDLTRPLPKLSFGTERTLGCFKR
jgi:hypothetical protein